MEMATVSMSCLTSDAEVGGQGMEGKEVILEDVAWHERDAPCMKRGRAGFGVTFKRAQKGERG